MACFITCFPKYGFLDILVLLRGLAICGVDYTRYQVLFYLHELNLHGRAVNGQFILSPIVTNDILLVVKVQKSVKL